MTILEIIRGWAIYRLIFENNTGWKNEIQNDIYQEEENRLNAEYFNGTMKYDNDELYNGQGQIEEPLSVVYMPVAVCNNCCSLQKSDEEDSHLEEVVEEEEVDDDDEEEEEETIWVEEEEVDDNDEEEEETIWVEEEEEVYNELDEIHERITNLEHTIMDTFTMQEMMVKNQTQQILAHLEPIVFLCFLIVLYLSILCRFGLKYYLTLLVVAILTMPRILKRMVLSSNSSPWSRDLEY